MKKPNNPGITSFLFDVLFLKLMSVLLILEFIWEKWVGSPAEIRL